MKIADNNNGFTLLETMIALVILAIGLLTYVGLQISAIRGNADAISITGKSNWAADQIERLLVLPYDDLAALDADGDGTGQDPLEEGRDGDDGGPAGGDGISNFGLDDATTTTADGNMTSPDGTYTIFWNVAVDHPLVNMVTLKAIVTSRKQGTQQKDVEFQYIKSTM